MQAPELDGAFILDQRAVYADITQRLPIETVQRAPVAAAAPPVGEGRQAATQQAAKQSAKRGNAASALWAPRREDSVSQGSTSVLSRAILVAQLGRGNYRPVIGKGCGGCP